MKCFLNGDKFCRNKYYLYTFEKKKYYKCKVCGLVFQEKYPTKKELESFYNKSYFKKNYTKSSKLFHLRKKQYFLDKKILLKHFEDKKSKRLLDFGCGNGEFISLFKSKKFGYEFNKKAILNKNVNRIHIKTLSKHKYDAIIMRGVIEHIPNFQSITKKLLKCLKKNGIFFITATPNTSSLSFFLSGKSFNQNHFGHINHFNHLNLSAFFLKNNLFNIDTCFQYYDTPYANYRKNFFALKKQFNNFVKGKNIKSYSPPSVGNMMTLVFKKII